MNASTPRFKVLPWDFFADGDASAPHVESLQISGAPREFELLKRGARVYFRLRNDNSRVWATLEDETEADFVRTFRRALGRGCIGRVFEHQRRGFNYERGFYFSLLMSARGEVQAREWCATRWFGMESDSPQLHKYLAANPNLGIFHPKWAPPFREVLEDNFNLFYDQLFEESERQLTQQRWFRGDAATLDRLVAPFVWHQYSPVPIHLLVSFNGGEIDSDRTPTSGPMPLETQSNLFPKNFKNLFAEHFHLGGIAWREHHWHGVDERKFWNLQKATYFARINANPSAHEQLEAQLFLRDWLTDKLSPSQIEKILKSLPL